jgi:hypothetical protein
MGGVGGMSVSSTTQVEPHQVLTVNTEKMLGVRKENFWT